MKLSTKALTVGLVSSALLLTGCKVESSSSTQEQGSREQESIMKRATNKIPTYTPSNFLTRDAVNEWMKRMDVPGKTFYIYLLGDNGTHIGYYVGKTRPVSVCTLMTPPQRLVRGDLGQYNGDFTMPAPSLDGVYGGGECSNNYFFFEASTDAYVEINGMDYFVSDQPLSVEAEPITFKSE